MTAITTGKGLAHIKDAPMSLYQYSIIIFCFACNISDGFDFISIALAGPYIAKEFGTTPAALGMVFGMGSAGMLVGALLSSLADRYGRRIVILTATGVVGIVMLATTFASSIFELTVCRFITGMCVGVIVPTLNVITSEYSNRRTANLAIGVLQVGIPAGLVLCSSTAALFVPDYGWRAIFYVAALINVTLVVVGYFAMPESFDFLIERQPPNALKRINDLLAKAGKPPLEALPEKEKQANEFGVRGIFSTRIYLVPVLFLGFGLFAHFTTSYFKNNWTPTILLEAGLSHNAAFAAAAIAGTGGVLGNLFMGLMASRYDAKWLTIAAFMLTGGGLFLFGMVPAQAFWLLGSTALVGFFSACAYSGLLMISTASFPTAIRGAGVGIIIAIGRIGAIVGPWGAGLLMGLGWERGGYFPVFAAVMVVGGLMLMMFTSRNTKEESDTTATLQHLTHSKGTQ